MKARGLEVLGFWALGFEASGSPRLAEGEGLRLGQISDNDDLKRHHATADIWV